MRGSEAGTVDMAAWDAASAVRLNAVAFTFAHQTAPAVVVRTFNARYEHQKNGRIKESCAETEML